MSFHFYYHRSTEEPEEPRNSPLTFPTTLPKMHIHLSVPTHCTNILIHHPTQMLSRQGTPKSSHLDKTTWGELEAPSFPASFPSS